MIKPRNDFTPLQDFGIGQSITALVFFGSPAMPSLLTNFPRNGTSVWKRQHFCGFNFNPHYLVRSNDFLSSGRCRISHRGGIHPLGGHGPLTWALFGENVCENKRIGSHGGHVPGMPPRSTNAKVCEMILKTCPKNIQIIKV